jgi:alkylglycerol monooxygenase
MPINVYALFTVPVLLLIVAEITYCLVRKKGYYTFQDSISSLGTAIINQCVNLVVSLLFYPAYKFLYEFWGTSLPDTWWSIALLFLGVDFLFYWFHRSGHKVNILWAAHMPHHSTEELNYAVALRASVTQRLASFFFYWPLTLFWSADLILPMVAFHLVLQLIPHTRVVPKLPKYIEGWLNTPSHHRVHHACNKQYRNTNFAGFLIIWDKMFGSYVEEVEEPYYGVTNPPLTWDPTKINTQWWGYLFSDMIHTKSWWDKIRLWFMPIGWRPADLPPRTAYRRPDGTAATIEKFSSKEIPQMRIYLVTQIALSMGVMLVVTWSTSPLSYLEKAILSLILWLACTNWAGILESKKWVLLAEPVKIAALGLMLLHLSQIYASNVPNIMTVIIAASLAQLGWFYFLTREFKQRISLSFLRD